MLELSNLNVTLPLRPSETDLGVILDATGADIVTIDVNNTRPDDQVGQLVTIVADAINAASNCAARSVNVTGFRGNPIRVEKAMSEIEHQGTVAMAEDEEPKAYMVIDRAGNYPVLPNVGKNAEGTLKPLFFRAESPPVDRLRVYPQDLTDDLRAILSLMMWNTGPMAHALRDGGQDIKRKAEDEQAEVMHWLIGLALEHGSEWRAKASDRIREIQASVKADASEGSTDE